MSVAVSGELKPGPEAVITPGSNDAESSLAHSRQIIDATDRFLVEIDDLLRRLSVGHRGNVDGQNVVRVEACLRGLQADERFEKHAGASKKHKGRGDLRYGENAEAAIGAAGDADAAACKTWSLRSVGAGKVRNESEK